jgi:tRNA A-37 threonylcarbamoyl transferase component Bud32
MRWLKKVSDDPLRKKEAQGWRWAIARGADKWLPFLLLNDSEDFILNTAGHEVIKDSPIRVAMIISGPHSNLFCKIYKIRGFKESLKHLFIPSKARKEWQMAQHALAKGIPTPEPLAMAERRKGWFLQDALLITEAISPSWPLIELIPEGGNKDLLFQTARLIKGAHEAGLLHQDLHAGNILMGKEDKKLYLIDLHRSKLLRNVSRRRRIWNLAQFFCSLKAWLTPDDKKAFLERYDESANSFAKGLEQGLREIEVQEERIQRRHMRSRTKRCLKQSGGFSLAKEHDWRIWCRRGWKSEGLLKIITKHRDIVAKGKEGLLKADRRTAITLFNYKKTRICVKEYRYKGALQRVKQVFRRSKARRGWLMGNGLVVRGIDGITPQALLERRRWGFLQEAFLLMESPPRCVELDRYMIKAFETQGQDATRKGVFLHALAKFVAELYLLNISHKDLKTCNIMVQEVEDTWNFGLVDMDDVCLDKKIRKRRLLKELVQLHTSTPLVIDMQDRIRFLVRYLQLIKKNGIWDTIKGVIKGSKGRELVYVTPHGDVIMDVDWEQACRSSGAQLPVTKKKL